MALNASALRCLQPRLAAGKSHPKTKVGAVYKRLALILVVCLVVVAGGYYFYGPREAGVLGTVQTWLAGFVRQPAPAQAPAAPAPTG